MLSRCVVYTRMLTGIHNKVEHGQCAGQREQVMLLLQTDIPVVQTETVDLCDRSVYTEPPLDF